MKKKPPKQRTCGSVRSSLSAPPRMRDTDAWCDILVKFRPRSQPPITVPARPTCVCRMLHNLLSPNITPRRHLCSWSGGWLRCHERRYDPLRSKTGLRRRVPYPSRCGNIILAHQYLDQLTLETRAAVFGNVGTAIAFRVGYADAVVLAGEFGCTFNPEQFSDLDRHEIFVRTLNDGEPGEAFRGRTLPPLSLRHRRRHILLTRTREKYTTPRESVESKLRRW